MGTRKPQWRSSRRSWIFHRVPHVRPFTPLTSLYQKHNFVKFRNWWPWVWPVVLRVILCTHFRHIHPQWCLLSHTHWEHLCDFVELFTITSPCNLLNPLRLFIRPFPQIASSPSLKESVKHRMFYTRVFLL